jgi:Gpi18-like mannosyltransferase
MDSTNAQPVTTTQPDVEERAPTAGIMETIPATPPLEVAPGPQAFWRRWFAAFKESWPVYVAVHVAFFVTTCLSFLFTLRDFDPNHVPVYKLWQTWHHWDTGHYMSIAIFGYVHPWSTAFFPLYPLLERVVMFLTGRNALVAGLFISNITGLLMLVVLYQLVREDFDHERALRTVLYLSIFPTAFFFAAGYNEALFLCLALLSFYNIRHGHWWLAGLFGFFACLTRSTGLLLLLPFGYEYLRQREFRLRAIRFDILAGALIPAALVLYGLYCYLLFHDFLEFSHAQAYWNHYLAAPWVGIAGSIRAISISGGLLSFQALRNLTDLVPDLLILVALILGIVGPWRFPRRLWSYCAFAIPLYIFLQIFPVGGTGLFPLQSVGRYMLEIFPAFIVLAGIGGRSRMFNMNYLMISGMVLFFLLTQFLIGHWVL